MCRAGRSDPDCGLVPDSPHGQERHGGKMELLRASDLRGGEAALLCTGARRNLHGMQAVGEADLCRVHLGAMFAVGWFSCAESLSAGVATSRVLGLPMPRVDSVGRA